MSERDLVRFLSRVFATNATNPTNAPKRSPASRTMATKRNRGNRAARVATLGIGDDAAILRSVRSREGQLVWTVDSSVEGVHFDLGFLSLTDVGARSFHAAVSDIAAMGARPLAALSSLVVPARLGARAVRQIARGQAQAAKALGCVVVGGNLARGAELSVTTTVLGVAKRPLERAGARVGDEVWLVGEVGLAAAGFRLLSSAGSGRRPHQSPAAKACIVAWRRPRALVQDGLRLALSARAAIDVSDGLAGDAGHLARASSVRVVLEEAALRRVLTAELLEAAKSLKMDALELALGGGEDYALVATGPALRRPRGARRIGRVVTGRGIVLEGVDGKVRPVVPGFDHFDGRKR